MSVGSRRRRWSRGEGEQREKGEVRVETTMSKVTLDLSRID